MFSPLAAHVLGLAADVDPVVPVEHLDAELGLDDAQVLIEGAEDADHMLHPFHFNGFLYHKDSFHGEVSSACVIFAIFSKQRARSVT